MSANKRIPALLLCIPTLIGTAMAANVPSALPTLERVTVMSAPKAITDFSLTDQDGKVRTFASLRGTPTLIFFGFTRCPEICPAAMTKLRLLHAANGGALKSAKVVLISVDGERDKPPVLKSYLSAFSSNFIGLTGDPRTVANIAARFSAVAFKEQPDPKGNYGYFHSSQIFLIDKDGRLRASFSDASLENMATITELLLRE